MASSALDFGGIREPVGGRSVVERAKSEAVGRQHEVSLPFEHGEREHAIRIDDCRAAPIDERASRLRRRRSECRVPCEHAFAVEPDARRPVRRDQRLRGGG